VREVVEALENDEVRMTNEARRGGRGLMLTGLVVLAQLFCAQPKEATVARQPAVAGQFYPADAKTLAAMVDSMLADAEVPAIAGRLIGIQVPHAGYPFSGPTAARAFKLLQGVDSVTVVMLGTSHQVMLDKAAVYAKGAWHTPLGDVAIDEALAKAILAQDEFFADMPTAHDKEHSIEVEVPFLQRVLGSFKIVPIMLLQPTFEQCERVGKAIAKAVQGRKALLVASSDLYHGESYDEANRLDSVTVGLMAKFDPQAFHVAYQRNEAQACGGNAITAMMVAAREMGADTAVVLAQTNSNDVTGERGGYCVGYSAVAFVGRDMTALSDRGLRGQTSDVSDRVPSDDLTGPEKKSLLRIARRTLESFIRSGKKPEVTPLTSRLGEKRGTFVTLHEGGALRGCIGYVEAVKPLYEAVSDMAIAASTEDPRFPAVRVEEFDKIDIEITVLSPLRPLSSPDSVVVGEHGLVIRKGFRSGLLLPQVPLEQGWDREQFLANTCLKAGLPSNAYKEKDAQLFTFTGQVFGEKELGRQQ
jgi:AmmeMemoRadiSam system protein B/AmmeMemoRadiSam system protein A